MTDYRGRTGSPTDGRFRSGLTRQVRTGMFVPCPPSEVLVCEAVYLLNVATVCLSRGVSVDVNVGPLS